MANSINALIPYNWKSIVQDFLNNKLVAKAICNTDFRDVLSSGSRVYWPQLATLVSQAYTPGSSITSTPVTAAESYLDIDQSRVVSFYMNPQEEAQAKASYTMKMAQQAAFVIADEMDKKVLATGINAAGTTVAGGAISSTTVYAVFTSARTKLSRKNAIDGELFAVVDPEREALLSQMQVADGFTLADRSLTNEYAGYTNGFKVYVSNNLPCSNTLTLDTNPTAGDTFTIMGVTFKIVSNGTAANAGEISLGANIGATQPIVVNAINGTGTPGASAYIEVSVEDRRLLTNNQVTASDFAANATTITATGRLDGAETFTAGTNVFGTETTALLFGRIGSIALGMQMLPELYIREEENGIGKFYHTHTLYGTKVFSRDVNRLVKVTCNA